MTPLPSRRLANKRDNASNQRPDTEIGEFLGELAPPYAILSDTWGDGKDEVSFRNLDDGRIKNATRRLKKLVGCCSQTLQDGVEYVWIDTCSIDKSNAIELGDFIFKWYRKASICYDYLLDVSTNEDFQNPRFTFFSVAVGS